MDGHLKYHPWRKGSDIAHENCHCRNNQKVAKFSTCIRKSSPVYKADLLVTPRCQVPPENCKAISHKTPASTTGICGILLELDPFIWMSRTTHHHHKELQEFFSNWKKIQNPHYHRYHNNLQIEGSVCQTCIPCKNHLFDNRSSSPK